MKSRFALIFSATMLAFLVVWGAGMASANDNGFTGGPSSLDVNILVGDGWHTFSFLDAGTFDLDGAFLFTSTTYVKVTVVDVYCKGDQFRIYDNGIPLDATSIVRTLPCDAPGYTGDPDVALHDPSYSHGYAILPPGSHAVTILATVSPFEGGGGAYLRVDSTTEPIPVLSGWGLFALSVLLVFCAIVVMRRRRISSSI